MAVTHKKDSEDVYYDLDYKICNFVDKFTSHEFITCIRIHNIYPEQGITMETNGYHGNDIMLTKNLNLKRWL